MRISLALLALIFMHALSATAHAQTTKITIATVDNADMIRMQGLTAEFKKKHPGIELEWVTYKENILRQRVATDIATAGGRYDIVTIGNYEVPIWAKEGWLVPLNDLPDSYDVDDLLPAIRKALTYEGELYGAPFYGESSMVMYRADLMQKAGLKMPAAPTWDFIRRAALQLTDKENNIYGICLRGKPGWGENMAFLTAMANSFGARWFDADWQPQFDNAAWRKTLSFYLDLMNKAGPPNAHSNGYNENLDLFLQGKCGIWVDATVAASHLTNPENSSVSEKVGFALAPNFGPGKRSNWLWTWSLAIPVGTLSEDAAKKFIAWATSKEYSRFVAASDGWSNVPPGTRKSLYKNPNYAKLPFTQITLDSISAAERTGRENETVPYKDIQFVDIPEFPRIARFVGQKFSAALAGEISLENALKNAQDYTRGEMKRSGYID